MRLSISQECRMGMLTHYPEYILSWGEECSLETINEKVKPEILRECHDSIWEGTGV
jgi:hypothetical protein